MLTNADDEEADSSNMSSPINEEPEDLEESGNKIDVNDGEDEATTSDDKDCPTSGCEDEVFQCNQTILTILMQLVSRTWSKMPRECH